MLIIYTTGVLMNRSQCPQCCDTGKDNLIHYPDGNYCMSCGYKEQDGKKMIQEKKVRPITPLGAFLPLSKRGISADTCKRYGVSVDTDRGLLMFPHYKDGKLTAQKLKSADKKIYWEGTPTDCTYFGSHIHNGHRDTIVITEGEEDCLAVSQTVGNYIHCTTLTNGANDVSKFVKKHYKKLIEYNKIVLCFDNDEAGNKATIEFKEHFPVGKVAIVKYSEKDASDMLAKGKVEELKWAVLKAEVDRPDGVLKFGDIDISFFEDKFERGYTLKFPQLTECLGGLRKGELTMLASGSGMGKSTWATDIVLDLLVDKGLSIADVKLEQGQKKTVYNYMALHNGVHFRLFRENPEVISKEVKEKTIKELEKLYVHNHFGSLDSDELLNTLDYYATICKVDFILLDHISIVISGNDGGRDGERKQIDKLVTKIRELIERTGVGVICISHLRNPPNGEQQWEEGRPIRRNDLRGSGSLTQLSDNVLAIEGNLRADDSSKFDRLIKVIKTRDGDEQEVYCDKYTWDVKSGSIQLINEAEREAIRAHNTKVLTEQDLEDII